MENINHKPSSESSVSAREQLLKTTLERVPEVLLKLADLFGQDSEQFMIAERLTDVLKREYEYLVAKRDYEDFCRQHNMQLEITGIYEISDMIQVKKALVDALEEVGLI
jgi:hypothetical protein